MTPEEAVQIQYNTFGELIGTYWPILACSFLVSLLATPVCRWCALRGHIVDKPDGELKPHAAPTPYLGGVAVFLGWAFGVLLALLMFDHVSHGVQEPNPGPCVDTSVMVGILVAGLAVVLLGLFDDLHLASPKVKLAAQIAVAVGLIAIGLGDDTIMIVLRSARISHYNIEPWLVMAYSAPLTLLIVLGACNATNLIDGMDGLCSGVLAIIAAGFLAIAVHLHLWGEWYTWDVQRVVLSLAMMGAALGFLPFNRSPAKIFMGDAGSMVLGLNAAILMLLFAESSAVKWFLGSIMVFGLPLADMVLTLARRWRSQRPLMQGDRSHYYDQLVDRGLPVKQIVRISYTLAAFFAVMGYLSTVLRTRHIVLVYFLVALVVAGVVKKYKMVRVDPLDPQPPAEDS